MPLDQKAIIKQIDDVLDKTNQFEPGPETLSTAFNMVLAAIQRLAPSGSTYANSVEGYEAQIPKGTIAISTAYGTARGTLQALGNDYESGYLQSVVELIHADIFADFLDMATHLLHQGYKDPAAVVAGSVLEEHLRKLCDKHGIPTIKADGKPKTADALNSELASANVYSKLEQKSVTAWQDLRNKAAHGKYTEYDKDQVAMLIQSVRDFAIRNPA
jgi:hypothetical protein